MGLPENCIPEDKLPPCWSDDVRMNALFAPFRIKSANPESWDMKMKFWSDMLRQWCRYKKDPIVSASEAKYAFQRRGRTPACIEIVVEEMLRSGELCPVSKYTQMLHNGPEGWVRWGARLAFKPAAFALTAAVSLLPARQALDTDGLPKASVDSTQSFVLESAIKEQATSFLEAFPPDEERLGTVDELLKRCQWQQSRETFQVLLGWLVAHGLAVKKDDIIKLAEPNKKVTPVTETDEALVKLISAEARLEADLTRLARDVCACDTDARAALQLGNRLAAKNHLRRKHKAQQRLDTCEGALENVKQLLQQMRDVDVNAAIVDTYRTSSQAMKRGMKESGLDEDAVHDTMDDLQEVLDNYNAIEKALSTTSEEFDAAELEQELRDLLSSPATPPAGGTPGKEKKRAGRETPESVPTLPTPPKEQPRASRPARKELEREFVFDGEERVIAELEALSVAEESSGGQRKAPVAVEEKSTPKSSKKSKSWYPPSSKFLTSWNNNPDFGELRQDDRLHPGQPLDVDFTSPPRLYTADFQVRDHKPSPSGVWLYNKDTNSNVDDLSASTEYVSTESPGKSGGSFQMAPGGERKSSAAWLGDSSTTEELERRLKNLRGFNL